MCVCVCGSVFSVREVLVACVQGCSITVTRNILKKWTDKSIITSCAREFDLIPLDGCGEIDNTHKCTCSGDDLYHTHICASHNSSLEGDTKLKLCQSAPLEMSFLVASFFDKVTIFGFWPKTME